MPLFSSPDLRVNPKHPPWENINVLIKHGRISQSVSDLWHRRNAGMVKVKSKRLRALELN